MENNDNKPGEEYRQHIEEKKRRHGCTKKRWFETEARAKLVRQKWQRVYKCLYCEGWHITSNKKEK